MLQVNNEVSSLPSLTSSQTDTDSIYRRYMHAPNTTHQRFSVTSAVQPDSEGTVLSTDQVTLKRHLGLFSGVCFIIGIIIGILFDLIVYLCSRKFYDS